MSISSSFYEEGTKLLTPGAFEFVLHAEIKRAARSRSFFTLITVEASRQLEGMMVTADEGMLQEVGEIIGREVRDTDPLGHTDKGGLALLLVDADFEDSTRVIARVALSFDNYEFRTALRISLSAACFPTHATDGDSLKRHALSRPIVNWQSGGRRSSTADNN